MSEQSPDPDSNGVDPTSQDAQHLAKLTDQAKKTNCPNNHTPNGAVDAVPIENTVDPSFMLPVVKRYRFVRALGMGGMSLVLLGHDQLLGREVAIKVLRDDLYDRVSAERRFYREARIHAQLQEAGIAPFYDMCRFEDGRPCIVMRYLRGKTLDEMLCERTEKKQEKGEIAPLIEIFASVCRTLAYAHRKGVIHRDLKPLNIMVSVHGQVQILDWGLAKVLGEDDPFEDVKGSRLRVAGTNGENAFETQVGASIGTPSYIAPEQANGRLDLVNERSDVFGLGAVLCEILTGEPPYIGTMEEINDFAMKGDLAGAYQRLDACPAPLPIIELAKHCLDPDPAKRPSNAGEVSSLLHNYLIGLTSEALHRNQKRSQKRSLRTDSQQRLLQAANSRPTQLIAIAIINVLLIVHIVLILLANMFF